MLNIKKISSTDKNFSETLQKYISQRKACTSEIKNTVLSIIDDVKKNGDKSIIIFQRNLIITQLKLLQNSKFQKRISFPR